MTSLVLKGALGSAHREVAAKGAPWARTQWAAVVNRPAAAGLALALAGVLVGALVSAAAWPTAKTHDEFSYLLAADTFCEGRLANPTHPHWQHFESFHIIHQPTYASKYPPGQGLFLALGQAMFGLPMAGVWLLNGLAAAATYWMLLAWTTRRWALLGGMLWLVHPGYQLLWGQSYWGGSLAYLGGALVAGAALRLRQRTQVVDSLAMAAGAVLLAVTRPYEGLIFCLLIGAWIVYHWTRIGFPSAKSLALRAILPQAVVLALGGAALGYYHWAVTGDPWTFPYSLHEAAYGQCPLFTGQTPSEPPAYRHGSIEAFHSGWSMDWYRAQQSFRGWLFTKLSVSWLAAEFFFPSLFGVALLLALPWRRQRLRAPLAIAVLALIVSLAAVFSFPHYLAPLAPLLTIAVITGLRRVDALSRARWDGLRLAPWLVALQVVLFVAAAATHAKAPPPAWAVQRAYISQQLESTPARHLILVRYSPDHSPHEEWVYNRADIDGSHIVWAREMDDLSNASLRRYYADRQAWLLEPDSGKLQPLPPLSVD